MKSIILSIGTLSTRTAFYLSVLTYLYTEETITAEKIFTVIASYSTISDNLTIGIPYGIAFIAEAKASLDRFNEILRKPILKEQRLEDINEYKKPRIALNNISVILNSDKTLFENLSLNAESGLIALTGPIGSGKSSLLKTILEDLEVISGEVQVRYIFNKKTNSVQSDLCRLCNVSTSTLSPAKN